MGGGSRQTGKLAPEVPAAFWETTSDFQGGSGAAAAGGMGAEVEAGWGSGAGTASPAVAPGGPGCAGAAADWDPCKGSRGNISWRMGVRCPFMDSHAGRSTKAPNTVRILSKQDWSSVLPKTRARLCLTCSLFQDFWEFRLHQQQPKRKRS